MAKKKSNINKYINDLGLNEVYSKISRGSSFIPGVIDNAKLSSRVVKKDESYKVEPFKKSTSDIRPVLSAGFSSRGNFRTKPLTTTLHLLDAYSDAAAAYSVRKLSSIYSGSALRVRRSSDNAEQDIGFSGNDLDTATMESFVGANDGFVVTWYDQSGSGNDATQSTAASQPQIVSSGTTITTGSSPSLLFATDNLSLTAISTTESDYSFFIASNSSGGGANSYYIDIQTGRLILNTGSAGAYYNTGVAWQNDNYGTGYVLSSYIFNDPNAYVYYNGVVTGVSPTTYTQVKAQGSIKIGSNNSAGASYYAGNIQEFIIYASNESANREGIESNINNYYAIH